VIGGARAWESGSAIEEVIKRETQACKTCPEQGRCELIVPNLDCVPSGAKGRALVCVGSNRKARLLEFRPHKERRKPSLLRKPDRPNQALKARIGTQ
jgi:hypothetical protein